MMPARSTLLPTMKPGTSCRNTSGMLKASHSMMKRAALSAECTSRAPPSTIGWVGAVPNERRERLLPSVRRVVARHDGRRLGVVLREVGEVVLDRPDARPVVLDLEVAAAPDLAVDLPA